MADMDSKTPSLYAHDDELVDTVRAYCPALLAVYRYGTAGGTYERPDSDVDIAVLLPDRLDFDVRLQLMTALAGLLGRDVDVVDMRTIPVTLRIQIVADGARLYADRPGVVSEYESRVFSDYARLNEERAGILEDIRARGSVYG